MSCEGLPSFAPSKFEMLTAVSMTAEIHGVMDAMVCNAV